MMAEHVENFIYGLIEKTRSNTLKWISVEKIDEWEKIKKQIQQSKEVNLKDYFIDDIKSYCISKSSGYVLLLNIRYGNAPVFSPALDKYILVVKINEDIMPENLSNYDFQGYQSLLLELLEEIEFQKSEECNMPDSLYMFFDKILGDD